MCQCEDLSAHRKPLIVSRAASFYDKEVDSDVEFLVGFEPEVWRFPGHKKILSEANPVFRALLEGPLATHEKTITIEDVESRAFDYLLRYLYGEKVTFQSASTALSTLYAAHKYLCLGLIELCVNYLVENLNGRNVLKIYSHAKFYAAKENKTDFEPSAPEMSTDSHDLLTPTHSYPPPLVTNNNSISNSNNNFHDENYKSLQKCWISYWSDVLVENCLAYIDENADHVLNQESIEDVSAENLKEIVKRDSLKISSENVVFLALDRWANRECKRRKLSLSPKNRRLVLGDLIYEIRFPFFSPDEFISGPIQGGLLNQQELTTFSGLISESKNNSFVPEKWKLHIDKACRKRIYYANPTPKTYLIRPEKSKELHKHHSLFRKIKNKNSKTVKESKSKGFKGGAGESEKSCSKCFPECLIDILMCLFD